MKIISWVVNIIVVCFLACSLSFAQDDAKKEGADVESAKNKWATTTWKKVGNLTKKKRSFAVEKTTTVAGVRGAEAEDNLLKQLYYKGGGTYPSRLELKNAIEILEQSVKMEPNDPSVPESMYFVGQCYIQLGENKKAIRAFEDLIEEHPDSDYALLAQKDLESLQ